jgi:hypothetical protein
MTYHNAHAALIDDSGVVRDVIVIPYMDDDDDKITEYCNSIGLEGRWIDCSYRGSRRGEYPSVGDTYDSVNNVFIKTMPDDSVTPERLEELANARNEA